MAALKKELRIMRTPEDASKLSQQVFWNKKIHSDACSNILNGAGARRLEPLEPLELLEPTYCFEDLNGAKRLEATGTTGTSETPMLWLC